MKIFLRLLRVLGVFLLCVLLLIACVFAWVFATETGTQTVVNRVLPMLNIQVEDSRGSLLNGLQVKHLSINVPAAQVDIQDIQLNVAWKRLLHKTLAIETLSVGDVHVQLLNAPETPEEKTEPAQVPVLPIDIVLEHLDLGHFSLVQANHEILPVEVNQLSIQQVQWIAKQAGLSLKNIEIVHPQLTTQLQGRVDVLDVTNSNFPLKLDLVADSHSQDKNSPLCSNPVMQQSLTKEGEECRVNLQLTLDGDLQDLLFTLIGKGEGISVNGQGKLNLSAAIPLVALESDIHIEKLLSAHINAQTESTRNREQQWKAKVQLKDADLSHFAPQSRLGADIEVSALALDLEKWQQAEIKLQFLEGSTWNKQHLQGGMHWLVEHLPQEPQWNAYHLTQANTDLTLGDSRVFTQGAFGKKGDKLALDINVPRLANIVSSLTGGVSLKGQVTDSVAQHHADLSLGYALKGSLQGKNPEVIAVKMVADGSWGEGWSGILQALKIDYKNYRLEQTPLTIKVIPAGEQGLPEWEVGQSKINALVSGKSMLEVHQQGSVGKKGTWTTKGAIHQFVINKKLIDELGKLTGQGESETEGIVVRGKGPNAVSNLALDINWDIAFDKALKGTASIVRHSGDLALPLTKPLPMGLKNLALKLGFSPVKDAHSILKGQLVLDTDNKGNAKIDISSDFNGLTPNLKGGTSLRAVGGIKDIAWASVFTNDLLSLGGAIAFDAQLKSMPSGKWHSSGVFTGKDLRIVEVENGVRLLNGSLRTTFNDTQVKIEQLHFPSIIRVTPKEWRTRQWIEENPPAQQGSLDITGQWDLEKAKGTIRTIFDHYPIVQRADRFAMMSGDIVMDAKMPKISVKGKLTADAGWASIDIKDTVPTVDGDVIVLKPGQTTIQPQGNASEDLSLNLTVDLGPRFYLVGMGLNSGLVGAITLVQEKGRLTAEGQFRTRGGAIEAYGQRLQIAKGEIAFGGNITNPSLNIEAIRRGLEVEAGLRVIGTAKRPKITLVSYPDVSDVEKLSWLIMGRGPDSSSADLALLFSVGSSLITDADSEPFYRKVGIDEIGMKAGSVGESDNILPKRTVADSAAYRGYEEASQLFYATKKFGDDWRVSVEQALSGSGTVVRGSYKLMRHLTVDAKVGTVNGIELLYKRIFKD